MTIGDDDVIEVDECAALVRRAPQTLRAYRQNKIGPPSSKVGGRIVYRRSDVIAWRDAEMARTRVGGPLTSTAADSLAASADSS